ncbi:M20/M25/M40 family metallo-hydrolase [Natrialba swarupiae]|nr:M20/M25/M40 family metallo-hydrolase [Natrialba swarupiae]
MPRTSFANQACRARRETRRRSSVHVSNRWARGERDRRVDRRRAREPSRVFGRRPGVRRSTEPARDQPRLREGQSLLFNGHVDVVPAGDVEQWSFDPYAGEVADGRLLGRGASDMKGGVAAMIYALAALERAGSNSRAI